MSQKEDRLVRAYQPLDELRRRLVYQALERGHSRRCAARLAGISWSNFSRWVADQTPLPPGEYFFGGDSALTFREAIEEAETAALVGLEDVVLRRALVDPSFALRVMSRRGVDLWRDPESDQRLREGVLREELLKMELEAARLELHLLHQELDRVRVPPGSDPEDLGGRGSGGPAQVIEIEYIDVPSADDGNGGGEGD